MEGIMAEVYRHEIGALRKRCGEVLKELEIIQEDSLNLTSKQKEVLEKAINLLKETQ